MSIRVSVLSVRLATHTMPLRTSTPAGPRPVANVDGLPPRGSTRASWSESERVTHRSPAPTARSTEVADSSRT